MASQVLVHLCKINRSSKIKPIDVQVKQVVMLQGSSVSRFDTYQSCVESVCGNFRMAVNSIKVSKGTVDIRKPELYFRSFSDI